MAMLRIIMLGTFIQVAFLWKTTARNDQILRCEENVSDDG